MEVARTVALALAAILLVAAGPAWAEMGPCKPDSHDGIVCGSGKGAARVVEDTISPNKRLALAWRAPKGEPTEEPGDDIELVLVRLADGAVLAARETEFWSTGEGRANRLREEAVWSPNSRIVIRAYHSRFSTDNLDLFVLGQKDELAGEVDLRKLVNPLLQAKVRGRAKDVDEWAFSFDSEKTSVGNDGTVRLRVMMWIPKDGPERNFQVTPRVTQAKASPSAQLLSIQPVRARR
jgi:hypothetical protein